MQKQDSSTPMITADLANGTCHETRRLYASSSRSHTHAHTHTHVNAHVAEAADAPV